MDTLTHGCFGLALGWALAGPPRQQEGPEDPAGTVAVQTARAVVWAAVLAAEAPDLDVFIRRIPGLWWVGHRGITHTLVAAPFIALAVALGVRLCLRRARLGPLWGTALLSVLVAHYFGDVITYRGIRPLLPWSSWRLSWPILPSFVDLRVILPLVTAAVAGGLRPAWRRWAGVGALGWLAVYLGYREWLYALAH